MVLCKPYERVFRPPEGSWTTGWKQLVRAMVCHLLTYVVPTDSPNPSFFFGPLIQWHRVFLTWFCAKLVTPILVFIINLLVAIQWNRLEGTSVRQKHGAVLHAPRIRLKLGLRKVLELITGSLYFYSLLYICFILICHCKAHMGIWENKTIHSSIHLHEAKCPWMTSPHFYHNLIDSI